MILVCNTGPLIALAKIDKMVILQNLDIERVLIPPMVQRELRSKIGSESSLIEFALNHFIDVSQLEGSDQRIVRATSHLDDGAKEVILLAASLQEDVLLLLDDQAGQNCARTWFRGPGNGRPAIIREATGLRRSRGSIA
jgi:predicted nucleic acid-binding protein